MGTYISSFSGPLNAGIDRVEVNGSSIGGGTSLRTIFYPSNGGWTQSGHPLGSWGVYRFTVYFSNPSTAPRGVFWTFTSGSLSEEYSGYFGDNYEIELPSNFYDKDVTVSLSLDTVIDTTQYYYYMLYDWTNGSPGTPLTGSIQTPLSSIPVPDVPGYTYLGFSFSSDWVLAGPMHNPNTGVCDYHSPQYPYVIFYYEITGSGGGGDEYDPLKDPDRSHEGLTGGLYNVTLRYEVVNQEAGVRYTFGDTYGSSSLELYGYGGAIIYVTDFVPTIEGYTFSYWGAVNIDTNKYIEENGEIKQYRPGSKTFWPAGNWQLETFWTKNSSNTGEGKVKVYTSAGWKDCTPYVYVMENGVLTKKECKAYINVDGTYSGWRLTKI